MDWRADYPLRMGGLAVTLAQREYITVRCFVAYCAFKLTVRRNCAELLAPWEDPSGPYWMGFGDMVYSPSLSLSTIAIIVCKLLYDSELRLG